MNNWRDIESDRVSLGNTVRQAFIMGCVMGTFIGVFVGLVIA